jgi:hypothetical protein
MENNYIIDTNVLIAANGHSSQVSESDVEKCQNFVAALFDNTSISVDSNNEIFDEYFRNLNISGQPGIGDGFLKYLWNNQYNNAVCETVEVIRDDKFFYQVFADKPNLIDFDKSDLKFIAVYLLSKRSPFIVNACDSDWMEAKYLLDAHGIIVMELLNGKKPLKGQFIFSCVYKCEITAFKIAALNLYTKISGIQISWTALILSAASCEGRIIR